MADQTLRLSAEVIDKFSGPLRHLKEELGKVKTPAGMRDMRDALERSSKAMAGVKALAGGVSSSLGLIGVGSLSASAALKAIIDAANGVAKRTVELRHMSREVGIAADQLRAFQALGERHQIAPEAMLRSIEEFADKMVDVRRRAPDSALFSELLKTNPQFADQLAKDTDNATAFGHALSFLGNIKNPMLQKRWADLFGLGEDTKLFDKDGGKGLAAELAQIEATQAKTTAQLEAAADRYEHAIAGFNESMDRFKTQIATPSLDLMTRVIDGATATEGMLETFYKGEFEQSNMLLNTMKEVKGIYDAMRNAPTTIPRALNNLAVSDEDKARLGQMQSARDMLAAKISRMGNNTGPDAETARNTLRELDAGIKALTDRLARQPASPGASGGPASVRQQSWHPGRGLIDLTHLTAFEGRRLSLAEHMDPALSERARRAQQDRERDPEAARGDAMLRRLSWQSVGGLVHFASLGQRQGGSAIGHAIAEGFVDYLRMQAAGGGFGPSGGGASLMQASYGDGSGVTSSPAHRAARDAVSSRGAHDDSPVGRFRGGHTFDAKAPQVMGRLMKDFGLTREQAAGIMGNLGHESGGFNQMQEVNPIGGGKGGYGWAQWTNTRGSPRRTQFFDWAKSHHLDPNSDEANYGYLRHELETSYARAIRALKGEHTVDGSMRTFEKYFEGALVKAYGSRSKWAQRALRDFAAHPNAPDQAAVDALKAHQDALAKHRDTMADHSRAPMPPNIGELGERGRAAGIGRRPEPMRHHVTGAASMDVNLRLPDGMSVRSTRGRTEGFVREIRVNRGQSMGRQPGEFGSA